MTRCIICKVSNMALEVKRHPNFTTIWWLNYIMRCIRDRREKDIAKICEDHRIPLKLTTCLSFAGKILSKANEDPRLLLLEKDSAAV